MNSTTSTATGTAAFTATTTTDLAVPSLHQRIARETSKAHRTATGCLIWQGYTLDRYAAAKFRRTPTRIARLIVAARDGLQVTGTTWVTTHSCDQPLCIEPTHLAHATQGTNLGEMKTRGRARNASSYTDTHREHARILRGAGITYDRIAAHLDITSKTARRWCRTDTTETASA